MSADTMKMPDPIIDPTTIIVESNRPRPRTKPDDSVCVGAPVTSGDLRSDIGPLLTATWQRLPLSDIPGPARLGWGSKSNRALQPVSRPPQHRLPRRVQA